MKTERKKENLEFGSLGGISDGERPPERISEAQKGLLKFVWGSVPGRKSFHFLDCL